MVGYDPINVISLTVESDNSVNSSYAKAGDTITIKIKHDGIVDTVQVYHRIYCIYYNVRG